MTYRAGVIGVGGVGAEHVRAYATTDGIEPVAFADVDESLLAETGDRYDVPRRSRYADHEAMLENESLDVVSVCSPTPFHRDQVITAARSSAAPDAIWCEKPIATSIADAEATVDACAELGIELVINHSRRWAPETETLRRMLAPDGSVGELRSVAAQWPLELLRNGTHCVDLLYRVLPGTFTRVSGHLTGSTEIDRAAPDDVRIDDVGGGGYLVTDDDVFVTLDSTLPRSCATRSLSFVGTEGMTTIRLDDGEWRYWRVDGGRQVETTHPAIEGGWTTAVGEYFDNAAVHLVALLDGTEQNRSPGPEALDVLELLIALCVSGYTGGHVDLPLERPFRSVSVSSW